MTKVKKSRTSTSRLIGKLINKVGKTSANQVRKDLGLGSHNTITKWCRDKIIPENKVAQVTKYLGL
jgi:hypothetical protein